MENKLTDFFIQIGRIIAESKASQEESRSRGEQFNMFHVCGVNHYEMTHSAILAELLSPDGSHGQKDSFLKLFLQTLEGKCLKWAASFDTATAVVQTEYVAKDGRVDILITNACRQAIIIENKIYAKDQMEQLKRYDAFAKETYGKGNYVILYLTLFGEWASEQSGGGIQYVNISYDKEILEWIKQCILHSVSMPIIRETLIQYSNHIKELTNQTMETEYREKLLEAMAAHAEVTAAVCNAQWEYQQYIVKEYVIPQLTAFAEEQGLKFDTCNLFGSQGERGFYFYKWEWKVGAIWFYTERSVLADFRWGISDYSGVRLAIPQRQLKCMSKSPDETWPYGWEPLQRYKDWDMNTMVDMVNGKYVSYIKQKVLAILKELSDEQLP